MTPLRTTVVAAVLGAAALGLAAPASAAPYRLVFGSYTGSIAAGAQSAGSGHVADAGCLMCVTFTARSGERSARVYVQDRTGLPVPFVIRGSSRPAACTDATIPVTPGKTYTVVPYLGAAGPACAGAATTGTVTVMLRR